MKRAVLWLLQFVMGLAMFGVIVCIGFAVWAFLPLDEKRMVFELGKVRRES